MISNWFKNLKKEDVHPAEETLLACVDGELSDKEAAKIRKHLENCWSCRAQLDELQETITLFVNFRSQVQNPLAPPPPNDWSDFDRKLAQAAENQKISIPNRLGFWQRFRQSLNFGEWSPVRKQLGIGATAVVLIVALLWQAVSVRNVSAAELLENSIRSDGQKIEKVEQPVIHQELRLERVGAKAVDWEMWRDPANSRYRQALADERGGRRFVAAGFEPEKIVSPDTTVLREVAEILQANGMNPQQPLSARSFQTWRNSLADKKDAVESLRSNDGEQIFILKTSSNDAAENGKIIEAALTVRAKDWHSQKLRLSVKSETGANEYEFVETAFEVVSLSSLDAEIFPRDGQTVKTEITAVSPITKPSPAVSPSVAAEENENANLIVQPSSSAPATVAATAELEVEILRLLNQIGADIGEEATVTRTAADQLLVQGVVESRQRKSEILGALAPVAGQPGLIVRIETSQEAQKRSERERTLAAKNKTSRENNEAVTIEPFEIRDAIPADAETRRYLRSKGFADDVLTNEVNRFATNTLNRSNGILLRALSLKNLANRFSDAQLRSMKPEARNSWLNLIAARASEIENQNAALRQELGAVFGSIAAGGGESVGADGEVGLKRAALRLGELAAGNDRAVRAAFTFSSGASVDAVKGAKFRESLGSVEGMANSLGAAARKLQRK